MKNSLAGLCVFAALLAGCGKSDSSSGSSSSSSTSSPKTPEESWKAMREKLLAKDFKGVMEFLSSESRKTMMKDAGEQLESIKKMSDEDSKAVAESMGTTPADLKRATPEEFLVMALKSKFSDPKELKEVEDTKFKDVKIDGDKAVVTLIKPDGKEDKGAMVKEGDTWKIDAAETDRLNGENK